MSTRPYLVAVRMYDGFFRAIADYESRDSAQAHADRLLEAIVVEMATP